MEYAKKRLNPIYRGLILPHSSCCEAGNIRNTQCSFVNNGNPLKSLSRFVIAVDPICDKAHMDMTCLLNNRHF